jgi:hypothetical protein
MKEITYWIITYTSIDGTEHRVSYPGFPSMTWEFTSEREAGEYSLTMPEWQNARVSQEWNIR